MNQDERRMILLHSLLKEQPEYRSLSIPSDAAGQRALLRSLMNVRPAAPITPEFAAVQDAYLQEETRQRGIVSLADLSPIQPGLYLWRGDITRLKVDAIVNAANSGLTGCYRPCHSCIDNCIHTYAGIQLRLRCDEIMQRQGHEEPTGQAKITPAYNLPCRFVLHTVGPIVHGSLTERHEQQLASCYRSCLALAEANDVASIAFCCISTGVFMFPNERAAQIAVQTVQQFCRQSHSKIEVIFNVFTQQDEQIYRALLG